MRSASLILSILGKLLGVVEVGKEAIMEVKGASGVGVVGVVEVDCVEAVVVV